jgi:hypothetical protein
MKTLFKLFFALAAVLFIAAPVADTYQVPAVEVVETLLIAGTATGIARFLYILAHPGKRTIEGMALAITVEVWENFIAENLYKSYQFVMRAKDRSAFVLNNSVVHIPQSGANVSTQRNRSAYPVPLVKRSDADLTYVIDEISGDAIHIKNAETIELSYDKINSVLGDYVQKLGQDVAKNAMYRWLAGLVAGNITRTTGGDVATYLTGTTGTRKKLMVADIASGKTILNNQTKTEMGNRVAVMSEDAYGQLRSDPAVDTDTKHANVGAVWKDGDLVRIHGFEIIRTDVLPRFDAGTPPAAKDTLDPTVSNAATDNDVVALIDMGKVHVAKSDVRFFETLNDALLQGDAYSGLVRMGAARERSDQAGVVAVVQIA